MLKVWTAQYKYEGKNRFDITVATGVKPFAPTWDMVSGYKDGKITEEEYTKQYMAKMRDSYNHRRDLWDWVIKQKELVLVCFCPAGAFCHRVLLANILVKLGAEYCGEIELEER
jgi:uncharacterized protein YeaO (DUF488 family)